jgi:hypothetical protein
MGDGADDAIDMAIGEMLLEENGEYDDGDYSLPGRSYLPLRSWVSREKLRQKAKAKYPGEEE